MALLEICTISQSMQALISDSASSSDLKAEAMKDGMVPLRDYGWEKAGHGFTTIEEILTVTATEGGGSKR